MPSKEEKKALAKKKREKENAKKMGKRDKSRISNSANDISDYRPKTTNSEENDPIHSFPCGHVHALSNTTNKTSTVNSSTNKNITKKTQSETQNNTKQIFVCCSTLPPHTSPLHPVHYHHNSRDFSMVQHSSPDLSKRKVAKQSGNNKFNFFQSLFKKSTDANIPVDNLNLFGARNNAKSSSPQQRPLSTGDSSESSITSSITSGTGASLFSASQYLSNPPFIDTSDCPISDGKLTRRNSSTSSSFLIRCVQNKHTIVSLPPDIRPNSIAFPVCPLAQVTQDVQTCADTNQHTRHSFAGVAHHSKDSSNISIINFEQGNKSQLCECHYNESRYVPCRTLEDSHQWDPVNPSHPDYPQIAKDMMNCAKSPHKMGSSYNSCFEDSKRFSAPSEADSGVDALDHHKQSMVSIGYSTNYNSYLSVGRNSYQDFTPSTNSDVYQMSTEIDDNFSELEFVESRNYANEAAHTNRQHSITPPTNTSSIIHCPQCEAESGEHGGYYIESKYQPNTYLVRTQPYHVHHGANNQRHSLAGTSPYYYPTNLYSHPIVVHPNPGYCLYYVPCTMGPHPVTPLTSGPPPMIGVMPPQTRRPTNKKSSDKYYGYGAPVQGEACGSNDVWRRDSVIERLQEHRSSSNSLQPHQEEDIESSLQLPRDDYCSHIKQSKPRRAKSLKDPSYREYNIPRVNPTYSNNSSHRFTSHERDVSFYTYIAPDPNYAKEIPRWLDDYSRIPVENSQMIAWDECPLEDLTCWHTLLNRLFKRDMEWLYKYYEDTRQALLEIIEERREELLKERIALENALISDETYV